MSAHTPFRSRPLSLVDVALGLPPFVSISLHRLQYIRGAHVTQRWYFHILRRGIEGGLGAGVCRLLLSLEMLDGLKRGRRD